MTWCSAEHGHLSEEWRCKVHVYGRCPQTVWLQMPLRHIKHWLHTLHVLYSWSLSSLTACMGDTVPSHPGVCRDCWINKVYRSGVDLYQPSASHRWPNLGSGWVLPTGGQLVPRSWVWNDRDRCTIPGALWWPHNCHSDGRPSHPIYHPGGGSHYNVLHFVPYQMQTLATERKVRLLFEYNHTTSTITCYNVCGKYSLALCSAGMKWSHSPMCKWQLPPVPAHSCLRTPVTSVLRESQLRAATCKPQLWPT